VGGYVDNIVGLTQSELMMEHNNSIVKLLEVQTPNYSLHISFKKAPPSTPHALRSSRPL